MLLSLLFSTKRHKSFSNFLSIADFFLSLLLLSLFMIDSTYLAIAHDLYFILLCVLSNDIHFHLVCSSIGIVLLVQRRCKQDMYKE
jgi:hypothetical protein